VEEALSKDIETQIRTKYLDTLKKDREVLEKQREELTKQGLQQNEIISKKLAEEKEKLTAEIKKEAGKELEGKLKLLETESLEKGEKLKELQLKELEFLKEKNKLQGAMDEMKIKLEREMLEKQNEVIANARKQEREQTELVVKELQKQLEDQKKLTEEMKRKQEQGSMQLQGEVQELFLEEMLQAAFPFDIIEEVAKGVRGADAVQTVRNNVGVVSGKIIYESKRTKNFDNKWIEKLKTDLRSQNADIAVIVTETMPRDMDHFGQKDGVWICTFAEARSLAFVLRESLIRISTVMASQENKGDKMVMLYNYLTGNEFALQLTAIIEGFESMKSSISKERMSMEKLWKEREKQLEKVLINAVGFYGSVKGIAGNSIPDIKLLEGDTKIDE
jgi:hypothetical protein